MIVLPARVLVCQRTLRWAVLVDEACARFGIGFDRWLILGQIAQESAGNPCALRPEPRFWTRYGVNVLKAIAASVSQRDDHWAQYPEIASASYGLMQVMYPVALEVGLDLEYPTELCDPALGIEAGCRVLRRAMHQRVDVVISPAVLLAFNGGADPTYPNKVAAWRDDVRTVAGDRL